MIYVSQSQLDQVQYLIHQSIQGNHVLFDAESVRRIMSAPHGPDAESYAIEPLIERLILQPTFAQKRAFLEKLDPETYERVVRTYFNIVENNIFETMETRH